MMINISPELTARIEKRIFAIKVAFGHKQAQIKSVDHYVETVMRKHLDKKDNLDKSGGNNGGLSWKKFRNQYFDEIFMRDKGRCQYCQKRLTKKQGTLDHILSPLRNGKNTPDNIKLSCTWCNNDKGILTDEEYYYKQLVNASKGVYPPGSHSSQISSKVMS